MIYKLSNNSNNLRIQSFGELLEPIEESLQAQTLQKVIDLWKSCFHDTQNYLEYYFQYKTEDNKIVASFEGEKMTSMVHLNPYEIMVNNEEVPSYYIVGVATREDYRKRGLMRKLLQASLQQMYQEKIPFTYLMPAKESIYLPFDFRTVAIQERIRLEKKDLHYTKETIDYKCIMIDAKNLMLFKDLSKYSNERLKQSNHVFTHRSRRYYEVLLAEMKSCNGGIVVIEKNHKICGYAAYVVEEGIIELIDYLFDDEVEIMKKVLMESILDQAIIRVKEETEEFTRPTIMTRIVNFKELIPYVKCNEDMSIRLRVVDPIIDANNEIYEISWEAGKCTVRQGEDEPELSVDISTLTSFIFGSITTEDLLKFTNKTSSESLEYRLNCIETLSTIHINEVV